MAQKTAAPFRTQVGKGFGRLDWPRSPPPTSPLSLPHHHHQRTGGGGWSAGRSWHSLGHACCLYRPALALLPGVAPSLPLLLHFLLHEKLAMSQDTCFLLHLVPHTLPILLGIKKSYSSSQDGGLHHARNMFRNLWRSEKGFGDETKGNSVVAAGPSSGWS